MGLEPTRPCEHKILSLARLPVPTLPHAVFSRFRLSETYYTSSKWYCKESFFENGLDMRMSLRVFKSKKT